MRKFSTYILVVVAMLLGVYGAEAASVNFANESLNYVITYKWGLIHKEAGSATLSLRNSGNDYRITLTARTKPWADKIFSVRDTLTATIAKNSFRPRRYVKLAHEGGRYAKDIIDYSYTGSSVKGSATRIRVKDGKRSESKAALTASGPTFDMLSIFYYLRSINYSTIATGKTVKATVFSGSKAETVTIRPAGTEIITLYNKKKTRALHLKFRFTTGGRKKSSDDMDVWLSDDSRHIPLLLIGKLPVGQVKCYYTGK